MTPPQEGGGGPSAADTRAARNKGLVRGGGAGGAAAGAAVAGAFVPGNSVTGAAEAMMGAAFAMAAGAGVLPPALMVAFQFKLATGKPQNLEKAAGYWESAAKDLEKAAQELKTLVEGIPGPAWNMDDRKKYESTAEEYRLQLDYLHNYCMAVHYALIVLAWALFAYAIFAVAMGGFLDGLAIAAVASAGTAYAACLGLATTAANVTWVVTGTLGMAGQLCGAVLAGGAAVTAGYQSSHGNDEAWAAFRKAVVTGSAGAGANLLQSAANAGLAYLNRSDGQIAKIPNSERTSGTHGFPLQEIDLDADRKYDTTWNIGGGAKVRIPHEGPELEVSGHRQWGPDGYAGSDFELKGKQPTPGGIVDLTGGIRKEWDGQGNEKTTYGVGAEQPHTGSKGGYEGTVGPDGKTENKATWVAPWGSQEKNFDPPWTDSGK